MEKHFAVSGFVLNQTKDKVLMVYHKKLGVWVIPGGHLEPDEYPHEGAKREILEETGVQVTIINSSPVLIDGTNKEIELPNPILTLSELFPARGDKPEHIHMDLIYLATADENQSLERQEKEVEDVRWMTFDEILASNTFESIKQLARTIRQGF